ncbi:hypothetical protein [Endozoicomonas elysicola]|uniref:Uncharacterized protein n=1 Tax=Endozoicomonas elysicola TaxID=305900 RepID=A0A081KBI4_9GAMM|nr:hypothetical protein [Endozoicomonas elysicola]KEI71510.1 hypothetical protein GV64_12850 [Endozoicomonas elysicola]
MKTRAFLLLLTLCITFEASAYQQIHRKVRARFEDEVKVMDHHMNLSKQQEAIIMQLKIDLLLRNNEARNKHGAGSKTFKAAKDVNMKTFQRGLKENVTAGQLQAYRDYLANKR